ncbi:hypothetical protein FJM67_05080 [Maribrevibacterium harenarium]|uniref:DUF7151 domain-containing protein n=1 Tax=Maribrevibacterium harenarium TaxID=2589817 RepID=A0A501WZR5_9GAMM|nr:hypothetical protein FJM67_05080 [Maribrevibacterium harenarium]
MATVEDTDNQTSTPTNITGELGIVTGQAIVAQSAIESLGSSECGTNGGIKITWGNDDNPANGKLDEREIVQTQYICHGEDGATGAKGDKGDTGAAGQNGLDGNDGDSAFFEKVAATTSNSSCTAGGWKFTFGTKNSSGDVVTSDTAEICNGVDGSDGTTTGGTVTANNLDDKIAQGKALVANAKTYLNKLTSQDMQAAYETYGADLEAAVSGDAVAPMYGAMVVTLSALIDGFVNEIDQTTFESQLSDMVADSYFVISQGSGYDVTINESGASVKGLIFQSTDINSTGQLTNYVVDMELDYIKSVEGNGDTTESLSVSSFTVTADQAYTLSFSDVGGAELKTKLGESVIDLIRSETDSAPALASADSGMSLALKGLTLKDFSNNLEFVADAHLAVLLDESAYETGDIAMSITGMGLQGKLTFGGETSSIGANITFPEGAVISDSAIDNFEYDLEEAYYNAGTISLPYTFEELTETYNGEELFVGYRLTFDFTPLNQPLIDVMTSYLAETPASLSEQLVSQRVVDFRVSESNLDEVSKLDSELYSDWAFNIAYATQVSEYNSDGLEMSAYNWRNSSSNFSDEATLQSYLQEWVEKYVDFGLGEYGSLAVSYSDPADIGMWFLDSYNSFYVDTLADSSFDTIALGGARNVQYSYGYTDSELTGSMDVDSVQAWVQSTIAEDMYIGFNLTDGNMSEVLSGDIQFDIAIGEGLDLTTSDNGAVSLVGLGDEGLHLTASVELVKGEYEWEHCYYYTGGADCHMHSDPESQPVNETFNVTVTDNDGGQLILKFQEPLVGQDYNALVRVDGVNVGQLVENNQGEPVIQFRDFEIVPLID